MRRHGSSFARYSADPPASRSSTCTRRKASGHLSGKRSTVARRAKHSSRGAGTSAVASPRNGLVPVALRQGSALAADGTKLRPIAHRKPSTCFAIDAPPDRFRPRHAPSVNSPGVAAAKPMAPNTPSGCFIAAVRALREDKRICPRPARCERRGDKPCGGRPASVGRPRIPIPLKRVVAGLRRV